MSWQLRLLTAAMRYFVKPILARTSTPEKAKRSLDFAAPLLFSKPRGLKHEIHRGAPDLHWFRAPGAHADATILFIHGGAFVAGSPNAYAAMAGRLSQRSGVSVCLPDYRLLQQDPFPAATDDVRAAWDQLIDSGRDPSRIVIAGDSAGGNLALVLLWQLLAEGCSPAAFLGFSPWVDLTLSGESLEANRKADPILPRERMEEVIELYLANADASDPRASPLLADYPNPPPALIQVGAEEILLSDALRISDKLGTTPSVWPGCPHVWQIFDSRLPEARLAMKQAGTFLQTSLDKANR